MLLPTKSCASPTIVDARDASPWWYAECSLTYPLSCATLMSCFSLRLKHENSTLRCDGLNPSTTDGMLLNKSALENKISSLFTNSSYLISSAVMSRKVPGSYAVSHFFRSSTLFLENAMSMRSPSFSVLHANVFLWCASSAKYSLASFAVLVPKPL